MWRGGEDTNIGRAPVEGAPASNARLPCPAEDALDPLASPISSEGSFRMGKNTIYVLWSFNEYKTT